MCVCAGRGGGGEGGGGNYVKLLSFLLKQRTTEKEKNLLPVGVDSILIK